MTNTSSFSLPGDIVLLAERARCASAAEIALRLGAEHLTLEDFAILLSPAMDEASFARLTAESARLTRLRFGYAISLYIPLYYDNRCVNRCDYCGFNARNDVPRRTLSREEIRREAEAIRSQGFTNLLLVAGEHPESADPNLLVPVVQDMHRMGFRSVSIEIAPLTEEDYRRLVTEAHLDGLYVYQETYDPAVYAAHHCGPKKDYRWRLETPERGARAGIPKIGIGFLLGLGDWRFDAVALAAHLMFLQRHYWQTEFSISFPRIRSAANSCNWRARSGSSFRRRRCRSRPVKNRPSVMQSFRSALPTFRREARPPRAATLSNTKTLPSSRSRTPVRPPQWQRRSGSGVSIRCGRTGSSSPPRLFEHPFGDQKIGHLLREKTVPARRHVDKVEEDVLRYPVEGI